jgi:hypothetical protein
MTDAPIDPAPASADGNFINSIDAAFSAFNNELNSDSGYESQAEPEVDHSDAPEPVPASEEPVTENGQAPEPDSTEPEPDALDVLNELNELDSPTKDWTPEAARRFKELKSELKTTKQLLQEREQALVERENRLKELDAVANNPEYDQLRTKVDEYERKLLVADLESSPAYQELVQQPLAELVDETYLLADKYDIDGDALIDSIALDDEAAQESALDDLLVGVTDRDKFRVYKIIDEIKPILHRRQVLRENAQEAIREAAELQQVRDQQHRAERALRRAETADKVAERLRSKVTFIEGLEGVDLKAVVKKAAEFDPSVADDVTSAYQVMTSELFPKLARQYVMLQREIDSLTDKLAEYDKAKPKAGGGSNTPNTGAPTNASFLDSVAAAFGDR